MQLAVRRYRSKSKGLRAYTYRYTRMDVVITPRTKERLKERARKEGRPMSVIIRNFILRGLAS